MVFQGIFDFELLCVFFTQKKTGGLDVLDIVLIYRIKPTSKHQTHQMLPDSPHQNPILDRMVHRSSQLYSMSDGFFGDERSNVSNVEQTQRPEGFSCFFRRGIRGDYLIEIEVFKNLQSSKNYKLQVAIV